MSKKIALLYDGEIFKNDKNHNGGRAGIFFVAHNILRLLVAHPMLDCYIYCLPEDRCYLEQYIKNKFGMDYSGKILSDRDNLEHIDVFFSPMFAKPEIIEHYPNITCYTILYDLIPILFPQIYKDTDHGWFHQVLNSINSRDFYFAISEHTKHDLLKYVADIHESQILVTPLATAGDFYVDKNQDTISGIKSKYHIPQNKKYLFSLCSLEPRKNLIRAVQAFIVFIEKNNINDLVYVLGGGAWGNFVEKLEKEVPNSSQYQDRIIRAGYVADEDLSALYSNAEWFVYTSAYEGFGMPPLEAMQCGCPVVVSNNSSLPEVVGQAGIMIDFDSIDQHVAAYERYYYDQTLAKSNSQKGLLQAAKFNWSGCVDTIVSKMLEVENKKRNTPLVTIVTITYNLIKNGRQESIKQCLESVHEQTYRNYEHIIIDGASTDGTLDLLSKYEKLGWIKVYSQPDAGIYDAMNKGIARANGKYINFMNSDDYFCVVDAIAISVAALEKTEADYSHANAILVNRGEENIWISDPSKAFISDYCHQTMFVKTDIIRKLGGFDTTYEIAADADLKMRLFKQKFRHVYLLKCIVKYNLEYGKSGMDYEKTAQEYCMALFKNWGKDIGMGLWECRDFFERRYLTEYSLAEHIELIAKVPLALNRKGYLHELVDKYTKNNAAVNIEVHRLIKKYYLFGFIPLIKLKHRNNRQDYYLFNFLRVLKVLEYNNKSKYLLLGFIPVWKSKQG